MVAIGLGAFGWGLVLILLNRLFDGLDGAVARAAGPTDLGGYLDIVADFAFYVSVPVGSGFAAAENLPYAMVLVATFVLTGVSAFSPSPRSRPSAATRRWRMAARRFSIRPELPKVWKR